MGEESSVKVQAIRSAEIWRAGGASVLLGGSSLVGQLSTALFYLVAARAYSPRQFGIFMTCIVLVFVTAELIDLGQNTRQLREYARRREALAWVNESFLPKMGIALITALGWTLVTTFLGLGVELASLSAVMIGHLCVQSLLVSLRVHQRLAALALVQAGERLVALCLSLLLISAGFNIGWVLSISFVGGQVFASSVAIFVSLRGKGAFDFIRSVKPKFTIELLQGWRFGAMSQLTNAGQLHMVLVVAIAGGAAGGLYAAAARISGVLILFVYTSITFLLPELSRSNLGFRDRGNRVKAQVLMTIVVLGATLTIFAAPQIASDVLGSEYRGATVPLMFLAASTIPSGLSQIYGALLISADRESLLLRIQIILALVGTAAVIAGATSHGAEGASIAALASATIGAVLIVNAGVRETRRPARIRTEFRKLEPN